ADPLDESRDGWPAGACARSRASGGERHEAPAARAVRRPSDAWRARADPAAWRARRRGLPRRWLVVLAPVGPGLANRRLHELDLRSDGARLERQVVPRAVRPGRGAQEPAPRGRHRADDRASAHDPLYTFLPE